MFGTRLLMLEHVGRRTGTRRYVVLEVVDRPTPGEYVSGFGDRAQWHRNIRAHCGVRVWCGLRRAAAATAPPMTEAEATAALDRYIRNHPGAWKNLRATLEHATGITVDTLPMVRRAPELTDISGHVFSASALTPPRECHRPAKFSRSGLLAERLVVGRGHTFVILLVGVRLVVLLGLVFSLQTLPVSGIVVRAQCATLRVGTRGPGVGDHGHGGESACDDG
ncbi:nitroreductase family deazaflavin-dependent oxidoreductase [Nocardia sp. NBC_01009]|uniref:nitroreductase family deazaflavin-dependent oxidoreductase n=1 Tax=Nocardia sp. NBC_01009 TaxID=2975996 RepID=UPI00386F711E|nr:nitroreductase family deazaflavin-dependent oxidoreductase [Nocardia sp. NBC_01009]